MTKKLYLYAALAMSMGLTACSSSDETTVTTPGNAVEFKPAQASKVLFTSNGTTLGGEDVVTYEAVETKAIDREAEKALCESVLPEKNGNIDNINTDFLYYAKDGDITFEMYPIYAQTSTNPQNFGIFYYDESGVMHKQLIWEGMNIYNLTRTDYGWDNETNTQVVSTFSKGIKVTVKQGYKFGFYWDGNFNWQDMKEGDPSDYKTVYYSSSYLNKEVFATDGGGNKISPETINQVHAGTFVRNGKTYLGLEDWTDFDYQDIIFSIDGELETVPSDNIIPGDTETPEEPVEPTTPVDPIDPAVPSGGSVEVNLALNAPHEQGDWIESHLSIHVRDTTDVTLFMPIEAQYYCPQDDMMIVQKHDIAYQYNETTETVTMNVNGNPVTLNITYSAAGITVSTEGINADVLKYCRSMYEDGINFEIRNYYNSSLTRQQIQEKLNNSVVSFAKQPKIYMYAKGMVEGAGVEDPFACVVMPDDIDDRTAPAAGELSMNEESMLYIYPVK